MFKDLGNLMSLLKNAQEIPAKVQAMTTQLRAQRAEGTAGGGMVTVELNGLSEAVSCHVDPSLIGEGGDRELLEDLLVAAINQAVTKARIMHAEAMQDVTGGMNLNLPGMPNPLGLAPGAEATPEDAGNDDSSSDERNPDGTT